MGCWRNFGLLVQGCVLRTAGNSIIWNYANPLTSLELLNHDDNKDMTLYDNMLMFTVGEEQVLSYWKYKKYENFSMGFNFSNPGTLVRCRISHWGLLLYIFKCQIIFYDFT